MKIELEIHSTKTLPPVVGELLMIADNNGFMIGWRMVEVRRVFYIRSIKNTEVLPNGNIRQTTQTWEYPTPKRGRKMVVQYLKDGYSEDEITSTMKNFRYIIMEDSLLETLANCKVVKN